MAAFPIPAHLAGTEAQGLALNEPVAQFRLGNFQNFVYLLLDWQTHEAAWIDPQSELDPALHALKEHGFTLKHLLLTHSHWDHVAGVPELLKRFPGISVHLHEQEAHRMKSGFSPIQDQEVLRVGTLAVQVLHTPGHSAGECCFFLPETQPPYLFSGDTLFIRDCGNTSQETGSNAELFQSLQRIKALPPQTVILPGHQYHRDCASTLEREMKLSAPLLCKTVDELARLP